MEKKLTGEKSKRKEGIGAFQGGGLKKIGIQCSLRGKLGRIQFYN